ncbi:hypothetical protein [Streptosporangium sp. CA-115845]|uniref:hypothetical protein n=1 Tax=Streptosporangium sp. CA-115845 TaxID=3240071 RepID=UPI003D8B4004
MPAAPSLLPSPLLPRRLPGRSTAPAPVARGGPAASAWLSVLALAAALLLGTGCTAAPPTSAPADTAASVSIPAPAVGTAPAPPSAGPPHRPGEEERAQRRTVLATARHFATRLLTYTHRAPHRLAPSRRIGALVTHRYAQELAARDAIDPALAVAQRESSRVHITSARLSAEAPNETGTQYVLLTCTQTLTLGGHTERLALSWSLRLLRFPGGWRVDEVIQAG